MVAYIKYARTTSGGVSVQVVRKDSNRSVVLLHCGTACDDVTLNVLIDQAEDYLGAGAQMTLDIGVDPVVRPRPTMADISNYHHRRSSDQQQELALPLVSDAVRKRETLSPRVVDSPARLTWQILAMVYNDLGFDAIDDDALKATVIARVVEPTSKAQVHRVLASLGVAAIHENTIYNSLKRCHERGYQKIISA